MGIVVSGEDGSGPTGKERQKANLLTAENDYGLMMATFDQVMTFLTSWWTVSLACRIQVRANSMATKTAYTDLGRPLRTTPTYHSLHW
jgi:hypothetical protein